MHLPAPPTDEEMDEVTRKLLAARHSIEDMRRLIRADSLAFVSIDGLYRAMGKPGRDPAQPAYCDACFSGDYPVRLTDFEASDGSGTPRSISRLAADRG